MLVVSDTSPITVLLQTGLDHLLPELFQHVIIPPAVRAELLQTHPILPGWLEVCALSSIPSAVRDAHLDLGEPSHSHSHLNSTQMPSCSMSKLGRRAALGLGLPVTGLLGILMLAKQTGHLPAIRPVILTLREKVGCWFAEPLVEQVLRAGGGISHGIAVELRAHFPGEIQQSCPKLCRIDAREFSRKRKTPVP